MNLAILFTLCILISHSSADIVFDFCVADLSLPDGPAGYACKDPNKVTADDFVSSALAVEGNTTNVFKSSRFDIESKDFPGLNGLGISMLRADLDVGGVASLHTHRVSELLYVDEGSVVAAFIDSNKRAYYKTLNKRDTMIVPPSLLHFFVNAGSTHAITYSFYPSENHGTQMVDFSLFGGNLPSDILEKVTLLDHDQVKNSKKLFGGTDN